MLVIYVGDAMSDVIAHIECPEHRKMPKDLAKFFKDWYWSSQDDALTVRTYTDTIVNLVGEMIEFEGVSHKYVKVITIHGESTYNEEGVLVNWPYGLFNY